MEWGTYREWDSDRDRGREGERDVLGGEDRRAIVHVWDWVSTIVRDGRFVCRVCARCIFPKPTTKCLFFFCVIYACVYDNIFSVCVRVRVWTPSLSKNITIRRGFVYFGLFSKMWWKSLRSITYSIPESSPNIFHILRRNTRLLRSVILSSHRGLADTYESNAD